MDSTEYKKLLDFKIDEILKNLASKNKEYLSTHDELNILLNKLNLNESKVVSFDENLHILCKILDEFES